VEPLAVDVREAARLISLSRFTVRRYIKRGLLRAVRVGRRVLVPIGELERLVGSSGQQPRVSGATTVSEKGAYVGKR
jgi:excisionase family DNA binding protein